MDSTDVVSPLPREVKNTSDNTSLLLLKGRIRSREFDGREPTLRQADGKDPAQSICPTL